MKILVTGAQGRVGSCVIKTLVDRGYWVRGVDLKPLDPAKPIMMDEYAQGDLLDPSFCTRAVEDVDAVIHIAGLILFDDRQVRRILDANWRATFELLEAMATSRKRFHRFIYSSSGQVYPDAPDQAYLYNPIDENHPLRISPAALPAGRPADALPAALLPCRRGRLPPDACGFAAKLPCRAPGDTGGQGGGPYPE